MGSQLVSVFAAPAMSILGELCPRAFTGGNNTGHDTLCHVSRTGNLTVETLDENDVAGLDTDRLRVRGVDPKLLREGLAQLGQIVKDMV